MPGVRALVAISVPCNSLPGRSRAMAAMASVAISAAGISQRRHRRRRPVGGWIGPWVRGIAAGREIAGVGDSLTGATALAATGAPQFIQNFWSDFTGLLHFKQSVGCETVVVAVEAPQILQKRAASGRVALHFGQFIASTPYLFAVNLLMTSLPVASRPDRYRPSHREPGSSSRPGGASYRRDRPGSSHSRVQHPSTTGSGPCWCRAPAKPTG